MASAMAVKSRAACATAGVLNRTLSPDEGQPYQATRTRLDSMAERIVLPDVVNLLT